MLLFPILYEAISKWFVSIDFSNKESNFPASISSARYIFTASYVNSVQGS